jgi:hypothetical protein
VKHDPPAVSRLLTCPRIATLAGAGRDLDKTAAVLSAGRMEHTPSGRYEAAVATVVAVLAVTVSAYTAYVQRQQVRAQVWPILEVNSGNEPELRLWIANKGVGPALIRNVHIDLDGKTVTEWNALLVQLYGRASYSFSVDTITNRVLSAGETLNAFIPHFSESQNELKVRFDRHDRFRVGMEICYCSTLGDCWRLISAAQKQPRTEEIRRCPAMDETSFRQ